MSDTHEVISAFLDDEPFDPSQLAEALSEQGGRDLLLDLLALRHLCSQKATKYRLPLSNSRGARHCTHSLLLPRYSWLSPEVISSVSVGAEWPFPTRRLRRES